MIDSVCGVSVWDDKEGHPTLRLENSSVTPIPGFRIGPLPILISLAVSILI